MKTRRLIALFVLSSFLLPDAALAMRFLQIENPCGKMICCCPSMCKKAKQKAPSCHTKLTITCGVVSIAAAPNAIPLNPLDPFGLTDIPVLLAPDREEWAAILHNDFYDSYIRSPLDKPPV